MVKFPKNKNGFTLIELIVVIGIIGILVLLATPKFMSRAREATINRAQHDAKVIENKNEEYSIFKGEATDKLREVTVNSLKLIVEEEDLVKKEGVVNELDESVSYYHIPSSFINKDYDIRKSTRDIAYLSENGDVYIDISARPPEYKDSEIDDGNEESHSGDGYFEVNGDGVLTNFFPEGENKTLPLLIEVDIPPTIGGVEVVEIDGGVFRGGQMHNMPNHRITKLTIPDTVKFIGQNAFSNNPLIEINLGNSVEYISENAFFADVEEGTAAISKLSIPASVKEVGFNAFAGLGIEELIFENKENRSVIIDRQAFQDNKLKQLHIPASIKEIARRAFYGNGLESLTMDDGVEIIGDSAFEGNTISGNLIIPDTVTSLSNTAFNYNEIKELVIGTGILNWSIRDNPIEKLVVKGETLTNPGHFRNAGPDKNIYIDEGSNPWGYVFMNGTYRKGTYWYNPESNGFDYSPEIQE